MKTIASKKTSGKKSTSTKAIRARSASAPPIAPPARPPVPSGSERSGMTKFRDEVAMLATYVSAIPALAALARRVELSLGGARKLRAAYVLDAVEALSGKVEDGMRLWVPPLDVFFGVAEALRTRRGLVIDFVAARRQAHSRARGRERQAASDHRIGLAWSVVTERHSSPTDRAAEIDAALPCEVS